MLINRRSFFTATGTAALAGLAGNLAAADDSLYAAIAYSPKTRMVGAWSGVGTEAAAKEKALEICRATDAEVVITAVDNHWAALATGDDGAWAASHGDSAAEATDKALAEVRKHTRSFTKIEMCLRGKGGLDTNVQFKGDFSDNQKRLLFDSLFLLRHRMTAEHIRENVRAIGAAENLVNGYAAAIGMDPANNKFLFDFQTSTYLKIRFPDVTFTAEYKDNDYWANAPTGVVKTKYGARESADVTGDFDVNVNTKWLLSAGDGSNKEVWAGVLAHEFLHNLGHSHGKDEYGDHLQINAVQQAVRTNGRYKKKDEVPKFRCGRQG